MTAEFVDTNVLVYAYDGGAGLKHIKAIELVRRLAANNAGALSIQVLTEFYAVATRKMGIPSEEAEEIILDFGAWSLHRPAHIDLVRSIALHRRYNVSWWDALLMNSALQLGCDVLWSEDFSNGQQYEAVTVRNPFL